MKKDIVLYLKKFIEFWNKNAKFNNLQLNKNLEKEFQDYMLYFVNLLDYAQFEDIPENKLAVKNICSNEKLWRIFYRNSDEYNALIKVYPNIENEIENNGYFLTFDPNDPKSINSFLDSYEKYVFDDEKNIICYRVLCATKELKYEYLKTGKNFSIEVFSDRNENQLSLRLIRKKDLVFRNEKSSDLKAEYLRVKDNLFVEKNALTSGLYLQLFELREKQSKVAVVDLKTQKILNEDEINERFGEKNKILKIIRHNVSAHNNVYYYKLSKLENYIGRIIFSEKDEITLFVDRNILYNILRQIDVVCDQRIKEYYFLDNPCRTQQVETDKIKDFLNSCKLYKVNFEKEVNEDLLEIFVLDVKEKYLKLSKIEKQEISLIEFFKKEFEEKFSNKIKFEETQIYTEKFEKIITKKVVNKEFKTYSEIGIYFMLFIKFFGLNVIKNLNGNKDYNFKIDIEFMRKLILGMFNFSNKNFCKEAKDFYMVSALCFITYINFIQNKLIDNIKKEKNLNEYSQNTKLFIEKVEKFDRENKIFTFSKRNFSDERPKSLDEYVFILRTIRNSIAHNNFAINYVSSCNIMDANLYFIDDSKVNKYELKVVCSFKDFLKFITSDIFADYDNENDVITGDNFNEIIKKTCEKFNFIED